MTKLVKATSNITSIPYPARFPRNFMWGAGHSPHQVEADQHSNWGAWEMSPKRISDLKTKGFLEKYGLDNFVAGRGTEFELRYAADFELALSQNHNTIRLGINWAVVEPKQGQFNTDALERYRSMILYALHAGLEPVITLYHWSHPLWFEEMGGWKHRNAPRAFEAFVEYTLGHIGALARYYTVLNEPDGVYARFSYLWGKWPPQETVDEETFARIVANLAEAHRLAYAYIRRTHPQALVGIAQAMTSHESDDPAWLLKSDAWNYGFIYRILPCLDFIGINNYFVSSKFDGKEYPGYNMDDAPGRDYLEDAVLSDFKWAMCPRSIYGVLKGAAECYPGVPLMITEHGHAVSEQYDQRRAWYLWESLKWINKAISEGVPLIGYLHWSLMDNFEWADGYRMQFGLWHVDRRTMLRTPRESSKLYADIIAANGLDLTIAKKYWHLIEKPF
jgi:beta-glucosidase